MQATIDYQIHWHDPKGAAAISSRLIPCPVCGSDSAKAAMLTTPSLADPQCPQPVTFLRCAVCSSLFTEDRAPFEYQAALSPWAEEFYLEQGAGLDAMIEPILHLPPEPRRSMLEIGCGFGFALHFAQWQRGWTTRGIDPSPVAAEGRRILGLDIHPAYLTERSRLDDAVYDVILASEVIEHLPLAGPVLQTVRTCLSPSGVLALTTPDAACVTPATDLGTLIPVLSPGHHLTLYSLTGLERQLRAAGFNSVKIERRDSGLVAWASPHRLLLRQPTGDDRTACNDWLASLANDPALPPPLRDGMAYRLLRALVDAGDVTSARGLFTKLAASCRERFGLDLLAPPPQCGERFRELLGGTPRQIPYNLPGLLYCRGMIALDGADPGEGAVWFDAAERAARGCCAFYASHGIADGETAALLRASPRLALLALCHRDATAVVGRLAEWPEVPLDAATEITLRLLDLGHLEAASAVAEHARSAMLGALAEGYIALIRRNDPKAAGTAFRTAERLTRSPSPELAERLLFGLVISAAHEDPAAALNRLRSAPIMPQRIVRSLFIRLVDLGHLADAAGLERLAEHLGDDWEVMNARAMLTLNHQRDGEAAAAVFAAAFARAHAVGVEGDPLWRIKYHEALAWKSVGRLGPAQAAARAVLHRAPGLPPVPAGIEEQVRALKLFGEAGERVC